MLQTTRAAVPRQGDFTANERLFLDAEGNVVDENSPDKNSLLVAKGGIISAADVERFGVTDRVTAYDPEAAIREAESGEAFANTAPQTNEDGTAKSGEGEQIARDVQAQEDAAPARSTRTAEKAADEPEKADSGDAGKGESRSSSKR